MGILETRKNRILLLIEQFKLGLKVQEGIEEIIKKSAVFYPELGFLDSLANKTSQGVALEDNLRDQISKEKSYNVKSFLEALTAKELALQKLDELRAGIISSEKEEFSRVMGVGGKIGWLAGIMFVPLFIYFFASLSEVFEVAGMGFTISDSTKIIIIIGCAIAISYILFSKRRKNG